MVKRTVSALNEEPVQQNFKKPSEKEHLFQISDIYDQNEHPEGFDIDDPDIVFAKCEVVGGDEEGRTLLNRCCLDDSRKEFYFTRMFLKAISCKYKGENFPIDSDEWQGRQFYATVVHSSNKDNTKTFANIKEYNFEKMVEQKIPISDLQKDTGHKEPEDEFAWDE